MIFKIYYSRKSVDFTDLDDMMKFGAQNWSNHATLPRSRCDYSNFGRKKRDNGTPVIINDDKTCYNQVKSTLFHFLTEFKHIGPFLKSRSF